MDTCPVCNGSGEIEVPLGFHTGDPEMDDWDWLPCEDCNGTGEIEGERYDRH